LFVACTLISNIILVGSKLKMVRTDAQRYVASVSDDHAARDRAEGELERYAVGQAISVAVIEAAVDDTPGPLEFRPVPKPAPSCALHFVREART